MSTEVNKTLVRRFIEEVWNQGKLAVFDELFAPNYINHDPFLPDVRTFEDYKRHVTATRSEFPDLHFMIEDLVAEGEQVVFRYTWRGTNTGELASPTMHIPATGKKVTVTGIAIGRCVGGKAVEGWNQQDSLGMYQQLGVIPAPQLVG